MKKNEVLTGRVVGLDFPNKGIVRIGDEECIVKNVIPGQTISFCVKKKRGKRYVGNLLEILEASPMETKVPCKHFRICGGCAYQTLSIEDEEKLKAGQVVSLIEGAAGGFEGALKDGWFEGMINILFAI